MASHTKLQSEPGNGFKIRGTCEIKKRAKSISIPGCTLIPSLLKDSHRHHDGRRRRTQHARGLGLLQGGDGGAVLCRVVGVWALVARKNWRLT